MKESAKRGEAAAAAAAATFAEINPPADRWVTRRPAGAPHILAHTEYVPCVDLINSQSV